MKETAARSRWRSRASGTVISGGPAVFAVFRRAQTGPATRGPSSGNPRGVLLTAAVCFLHIWRSLMGRRFQDRGTRAEREEGEGQSFFAEMFVGLRDQLSRQHGHDACAETPPETESRRKSGADCKDWVFRKPAREQLL